MEITKKILEKLIFEEHMTDMDIANHFDVHCSKITGLRFKYKIKRLHKNNEWLIDQYCNQKRTIISIANEAGVNRDEVRKELRKLNIEPDYEIMRHGSKKHDYDESVFNVIDTEEKAYWLGFLMGDGDIEKVKRKRSNGSYYINHRLNLNLKYSDIGHINKFLNFLKCTTVTPKKKLVKMPSGNLAEIASIRISSKPLAESLINHGVISNKSLNEPEPIELSEKFIPDFIRGLFDADGCIANAKGNSVGTVSMCDGKILMEWVKKQYPFFKIKEDNISKGLYILSLYKQDDKLSFLNSIYGNANIFLDRKYEMYLETKLKIESKLIRNNKKKNKTVKSQ